MVDSVRYRARYDVTQNTNRDNVIMAPCKTAWVEKEYNLDRIFETQKQHNIAHVKLATGETERSLVPDI